MVYVFTDEEKRVFEECNSESFRYRSLPFSLVAASVTHFLVAKGTLSSSPMFGSLPKVAFAGFCAYLLGKMTYIKTCQEKFRRLENSPIGEAIRKGGTMPTEPVKDPQSEMSDPDAQSFDTMFIPADATGQTPVNTRDNIYGYNAELPVTMGRRDDFTAPVDDEEPRKKATLYEDLRLKNRENYEVTLTQKAETLLKRTPEKEPARHKKDYKKNIYGDSLEE